MKPRSYLTKILFLALTSSMLWLSCEKENNQTLINEAQTTIEVDIPDPIASSFTAQELSDYFQEIETAKANNLDAYEFIPVMIKMEADLSYYKESPYLAGIRFEGSGNWEDVGPIRYFEKVTYPVNPSFIPPGSGGDGEGTIFLRATPPAEDWVLPREELIAFNSFDRVETDVTPRPEDGQPSRFVMYKSRLSFYDGYGKYERCFGSATKVEVQNVRTPEKATITILGYVFIKPESPDNPDK